MADRLQFTPPHPSWRYFVALHPRLVGIVLLATVVSMACTTPTVAPDCALTLSFSHPVVEGSEKVTFKPRLKGRFHWNSPTELTFEPAAPLTAGQGVIVTVKGARSREPEVLPIVEQSSTLSVSELMIAGKVVEWPVLKGLPRLVTPLTIRDRFGAGGLMLDLSSQLQRSRAS